MNQVILIGFIGKDPEVKKIADNSFTRFTLATKRGKDKTDWHNVTAWGQAGEIIANYCKKGSKVCVQGSVNYSEFDKDGQKRTFTEINVNQVELLDSKSDGEKSAPSKELIDEVKKTMPKQEAKPQPKAEQNDLPF